MTSPHWREEVEGLTHAERVMAVVSRRDGASLTVTRALVPLNDSAAPYFPEAVQAAAPTAPLLPFPGVGGGGPRPLVERVGGHQARGLAHGVEGGGQVAVLVRHHDLVGLRPAIGPAGELVGRPAARLDGGIDRVLEPLDVVEDERRRLADPVDHHRQPRGNGVEREVDLVGEDRQ